MLKEIHEEMLDIYVNKMKHISDTTAKAYSKIISKFIMFSPSIDPSDLEKYIKFEFNLKNLNEAQKDQLKGTSANYFNCINLFLKHVYNSKFFVLYPEFASMISDEVNQTCGLPSLLEITRAYIELMEMSLYQDATIIHLMYSLGANPETIALLTFDTLDEQGNMTYFDTLSEKYKTILLSEALLSDIIFLRNYRLSKEENVADSCRCHNFKFVIMGDFIISISATAIYNRFSRKFGGKLKWFKYKPHQIVKLSKSILSVETDKEEQNCLDLVADTINSTEDYYEK